MQPFRASVFIAYSMSIFHTVSDKNLRCGKAGYEATVLYGWMMDDLHNITSMLAGD